MFAFQKLTNSDESIYQLLELHYALYRSSNIFATGTRSCELLTLLFKRYLISYFIIIYNYDIIYTLTNYFLLDLLLHIFAIYKRRMRSFAEDYISRVSRAINDQESRK